MNKKLILTHANCTDGCCSRAILEQVYGNNAIYIAVDHVDYDPKFENQYKAFVEQVSHVKDTEIIMADICLPSSWINLFLQNNNKVVILDHHKTSIPIIEEFEQRIKNGEKINMQFSFSKENSESGAMITWKYVNKNIEPPKALVYISEGDIWKIKHVETNYFYAGLLDNKQPKDYDSKFWLSLLTQPSVAEDIIEYGKPIHEKFLEEIKAYSEQAISITLDGRHGLMVFTNTPYKSQLGNVLAEKCNGFGFLVEQQENSLHCSFRCIAPSVVDDLAKKFGGGGHAQIAAFKLSNMQDLQDILDNEGNHINVLNGNVVKLKKSKI
jgi:nanoRNase/pAp phosphatase (c-di-AMP/oligoRNAs hydrolase)